MRTFPSIARIAGSACCLLAFSGPEWHDGLLFVPPAKDIAGHNVLQIYDINGPDWPVNMPDDVLPDWCGRLWVAYAGNGIVAFDASAGRVTDVLRGARRAQVAPSSKLYEGRDGNLWFLSDRHIMTIRCDGKQRAEERVSSVDGVGPASDMFQDRERNLWFMTKSGLVYHDGRQFSKPLRPPNPVESAYRALPFRGFDRAHQPQVRAEEGESRAITEATDGVEAADGRIWLASLRAVVTFDRRLNKWGVISLPDGIDVPTLIHEGTGGAIWLITGADQAQMYNTIAGRWSGVDASSHRPATEQNDLILFVVNGIYQDSAGTLMLATNKGLLTFNPALDKWGAFTSKNSALPDSFLTGISAARDGTIWITGQSEIVVLAP